MAKHALLVGISEYQDLGISDLLYAAKDAEVLGVIADLRRKSGISADLIAPQDPPD